MSLVGGFGNFHQSFHICFYLVPVSRGGMCSSGENFSFPRHPQAHFIHNCSIEFLIRLLALSLSNTTHSTQMGHWPEYGQTMVATTRGDVYSFGVVMMELVTGRAPTGQADIEGGNLVGWVRRMFATGRQCEVFDPFVSNSTMWKDQMLHVLRIAGANRDALYEQTDLQKTP